MSTEHSKAKLVFVNIKTGDAVKAIASDVCCKLIDGTPVRAGDYVVEDGDGNRTVFKRDDFHREFEPAVTGRKTPPEQRPWEKPAITELPQPSITNAFVLGAFDRHDARSIEKAWLEVEAAVQLLAKRTMQLQPLNGASRESAQASLRLREAAFWLSQRKQIVAATVQEIAAAVA